MLPVLLRLEGLGLSVGPRIILAEIGLRMECCGATVLMGPGGAGKSSLLRWLSNDLAQPSPYLSWGLAEYQGQPISSSNRPALMEQKAKLLTSTVLENCLSRWPSRGEHTQAEQRCHFQQWLEAHDSGDLAACLDDSVLSLPQGAQRRLAFLRTLIGDPPLILLDEPADDLEPAQASRLLELIILESTRRAVLMVTHNLEHARRIGGHTALLAGGRIQEQGDSREFFENPQSEPAQVFVKTGCCCVASPDARPEELALEHQERSPLPPAAIEVMREKLRPAVLETERIAPPSESLGPPGFRWFLPGVLAGFPQPGLMRSLDYDLDGLRRTGINTIISLTDEMPFALDSASDFLVFHFPIKDMEAPEFEPTFSLCRQMGRWIEQGRRIGVHCRAGYGRTGLILVAYALHLGGRMPAVLDSARRIEPNWVQSAVQERFLLEFDIRIAATGRGRPG